LGGQKRVCHLEMGHSRRLRHSDMPYLLHLKEKYGKIASKIERDALNTRSAAWPKNQMECKKG
jgi:hypothetical protein